MGYQENTYIIDPEVDSEKEFVQKPMESVSIPNNTINRDYEIIDDPEPQPVTSRDLDEIHKAAVQEGLVDEEEEYIGGEGASPKDVINGLINKERSEGAQKNEKEYAEQKINKTKKIMATREILTGMTKRLINVVVPVVLDVKQGDGSVDPELVDLELKVRRLTESQINHLFNRRMAGKKVEDMTNEELQEDNHFRAKFLSEAVVEPKMDEGTWYNEVPAIALGTIFNAVNDALSSIDNTELFQ